MSRPYNILKLRLKSNPMDAGLLGQGGNTHILQTYCWKTGLRQESASVPMCV